MTKEELEKEAEEIAKDIYYHHFADVIYLEALKAITEGVHKGAEPREERIAELEAENLQLLKEWRVMDKAKQKAELKVAELMGDVSTLEQDYKRLEAQIEKMKNWCNCKNYQKCLIELAEQCKGMKPSECCVNCKKWEIKENVL